MGIVYIFTNRINGKQYVGKTIQRFKRRLGQHLSVAKNFGDNSIFHKAIRKYGIDMFDVKQIKIPKLKLLAYEKYMIAKLNTKAPNGYNLTDGGEGTNGRVCSKTTRNKISKSQLGKKLSNEHKRKISKGNKGKFVTTTTRRRMSKANTGKNNSCYGLFGGDNPTSKEYIITTPEGEEIFVKGIKKFCRDWKRDKLSKSHLIQVARGKWKQHKGYRCRYA